MISCCSSVCPTSQRKEMLVSVRCIADGCNVFPSLKPAIALSGSEGLTGNAETSLTFREGGGTSRGSLPRGHFEKRRTASEKRTSEERQTCKTTLNSSGRPPCEKAGEFKLGRYIICCPVMMWFAYDIHQTLSFGHLLLTNAKEKATKPTHTP